MLKQKTLKDSFSLSGKGLHTGLDLTVTFNPAPWKPHVALFCRRMELK